MSITYSPSTGFCIEGGSADLPIHAYSLLSGREIDTSCDQQIIHLASDWREVVSNDRDVARHDAKIHAQLEYCRTLLQVLVKVPHCNEIDAGLHQVETKLATNVSSKLLTSRLLIAPLANVESWHTLAVNALELGYAGTAEVMNDVCELQPNLRRLTEYWSAMPTNHFLELGVQKVEMWRSLVDTGDVLQILQAGSKSDINVVFSTRVFDIGVPKQRSAMVKIGSELAAHLGGELAVRPRNVDTLESEWGEIAYSRRSDDQEVSAHDAYKRALKEVQAITESVAEGKDSNAVKFLEELVARQREYGADEDFVLKSLCNIAQQSADMFRPDFEVYCLEKAAKIAPDDPWVLVQLGDHYKRTGDFAEAKRLLEKAVSLDSKNTVPRTALADVYAQEGLVDSAVRKYMEIPDWESDEIIRTAMADLLRKTGQIDKAERDYKKLESSGYRSDRTRAGLAEVHKIRGNLRKAERIYRDLLNDKDVSGRAQWIYRMALAGILKQQGALDDAYVVVKEALESRPFAMQAKVLQASLLGLMNKESDALEILSDPKKSGAFEEWVSVYTRGLLLMRTKKFSDARSEILSSLESAVLDENAKNILRMAAAVSYLADKDAAKAGGVLAGISLESSYGQYLLDMLNYHKAVILNEQKERNRIMRRLKRNRAREPLLWDVAIRLKQGDLSKAIVGEVEGLLRLAA